MDSSESPTYGDQEGSAYNGHFGCTCYHPLFVFNQFGDERCCALRSGNVHSADGWRAVLEPVIPRYRDTGKRFYFRGDAAFANPEMYEFLEAERASYTIGAWWPRSSGIRVSSTRASASSSPTWRGPPSAWWLSTTSAAPASSSSRKERARSNGRGCRAGLLLPMRSVSSFTCWHTPGQLYADAGDAQVGGAGVASLREKLVKIGAKVVSHGRYVTFQMAEVALSRLMFQEILTLIARLRTPTSSA